MNTNSIESFAAMEHIEAGDWDRFLLRLQAAIRARMATDGYKAHIVVGDGPAVTSDAGMKRYVLTFGVGKPGICKGWVEVSARSEDVARWWARETYGRCWAGIYDVDEFVRIGGLRGRYPLGRLADETLHHEEVPS